MQPITYKGFEIRPATDWEKKISNFVYDQVGEIVRYANSIEDAEQQIDEIKEDKQDC